MIFGTTRYWPSRENQDGRESLGEICARRWAAVARTTEFGRGRDASPGFTTIARFVRIFAVELKYQLQVSVAKQSDREFCWAGCG
jgi:hypothetical protein